MDVGVLRNIIRVPTPQVLKSLPLAIVSGGQVWLGIENIKLKETANAVEQLPQKPAKSKQESYDINCTNRLSENLKKLLPDITGHHQ